MMNYKYPVSIIGVLGFSVRGKYRGWGSLTLLAGRTRQGQGNYNRIFMADKTMSVGVLWIVALQIKKNKDASLS